MVGYWGCSVAVGCHHGSTAIWSAGCRRHLSSFCLSICLSKADDQWTVSEIDWNPKVLREAGKRDLSFYSSDLFRCSAPVLPSVSLWYFYLYTEVALSFTTPMWWVSFPPNVMPDYSAVGVRNAPSDLKWSFRKMGWQHARADVVNNDGLVWLSEIMKTREGKAEINLSW